MPFALLFLLLQLSLLSPALTPTLATTALAPATPPGHINLTAISAKDGASILECWQLSAPFITSSEPGTAGAASTMLGATESTTYSILPPKFDGGLHNAPAVQYVAFTTGEAVITFPNSTETTTVHGGKNGLIFAADTAAVSKFGHITRYPSGKETIALQIRTAGGVVPPHTVLYARACHGQELVR